MGNEFDLEYNIAIWKKELRKSHWLDDGMIMELEMHLRDHIEDLLYYGYNLRDAFYQATRVLGPADKISIEENRNIRVSGSGCPFDLWINFLRINFRRIFRYGIYKFINILGLALGITGFLLISFYLVDEWNYDKMHPEFEKIYRLSYVQIAEDGTKQPQAYSSAGWAPVSYCQKGTGDTYLYCQWKNHKRNCSYAEYFGTYRYKSPEKPYLKISCKEYC